VMSELINYFSDNKNAEVHLILYGIKRDIFYSISNSIKVHRPQFEFNNKIRTAHTIKTLFYLRKKVKEINPDTILSFGELWNNFVLLALSGLSYPVYVSDRCRPNKKLSKFHEVLRAILYPKATGIVAQTEKAKTILSKKFHHSNIKVIGNPIREIVGFNSNGVKKENIILSVGRLIESKHHDRLIDLFLDIEMPRWKLVIVGGDAQRQNGMEKLKRLIRKHQAEDRVCLEGYQKDIESYYIKSKIFAFTSSSEGFPNVIGEALSAGLPVIAFDCVAGPSEMIKDGENGYLVPLFDYETFREKLKKLMENEIIRNRMAENSKRSMRKFSIEKIGDKYFHFIADEKPTAVPEEMISC